MDDSKVFQKRLNEKMLEKGVTKIAIAKASGVSAAMVGKYVSGKAFPACGVGAKLAKALDCSIDFLFGLTDVERPIKTDDYFKLETFEDLYSIISRILCIMWDSSFERKVLVETLPDGGVDIANGEFINEIPAGEVLRLDLRNKDFIQFYRRIEDARKLSGRFGNDVADLAIRRIHDEMQVKKLPTEKMPF